MTGEAEQGDAFKRRFPGFRVMGQADHWDDVTRAVVEARLEPPKPLAFIPDLLAATAVQLVARLIDVDDGFALGLLSSIDTRLAADETDGFHYDDMPIDQDAWLAALRGLDDDAQQAHGGSFATLSAGEQHDLLVAFSSSDADRWHGMPPARAFSLLLRYVCSAYYAHPAAWDEMGFPGPAYPRGYKNPGIDSREPFEVADTMPHMDPTVSSAP